MVMKQLEKKLGLPPLIEISEVLKNLPDEKKLRLVKAVLESASKVKGSPQELQMVLDLIRLITSANMEQLTAIRDITSNIVKLAKYLPKEGLPLKEIVEEFRKGG